MPLAVQGNMFSKRTNEPKKATGPVPDGPARRFFMTGLVMGVLGGMIGGSLMVPGPPERDPVPEATPQDGGVGDISERPDVFRFPGEGPQQGSPEVPSIPGAPAGWITGTLVDWSGNPIPQGMVRAVLDGDPARLANAGNTGNTEHEVAIESARKVVVRTQREGRFAIYGLHLGEKYRLAGFPSPVPPRKQFDLREHKGFPLQTELVVDAPAQDVRLPLMIHRVHVQLLGPYEFLSEPDPSGKSTEVEFDVTLRTEHEEIKFEDLKETGFDILVDPESKFDIFIENPRIERVELIGLSVKRPQLETPIAINMKIRKSSRVLLFEVKDQEGNPIQEAAVREIGLATGQGTEGIGSRRTRSPLLGMRFSSRGVFSLTTVQEGTRKFEITAKDPKYLQKAVVVNVPFEGEVTTQVELERGGFLRVVMDPQCANPDYRVELYQRDDFDSVLMNVRFKEHRSPQRRADIRLSRGRTYDCDRTLQVGKYFLRVYFSEGRRREFPVQITGGQTTRVEVNLSK